MIELVVIRQSGTAIKGECPVGIPSVVKWLFAMLVQSACPAGGPYLPRHLHRGCQLQASIDVQIRGAFSCRTFAQHVVSPLALTGRSVNLVRFIAGS